MSDTTQENDPSIEEILASIRQIISDDDEEEGTTEGEEKPPADVVEEEPAPEAEPADEEDVLELTEKVDDPEPVEPATEPEQIVEPEPEEEPVMEEPIAEEPEEIEVDLSEPEDNAPTETTDIPEGLDTNILSQGAAAATLAGFTKIARDIQVNRTFDGITLEDIVRAQLEPLLKEWLDKNLPPMIEVLVEKELDKLSKKALND